MNNNFTINPYNKVLIIGNGFDLDLGLATRCNLWISHLSQTSSKFFS